MDKRAALIIVILLVGIIAGTMIFMANKASIVKANNNSFEVKYQTLGTLKVYNVSALTPFLSHYLNSSYVKLASSVVKYGIVNVIRINQSKGIIGYFKAGPLSSLAFYQLNSTLTSHGFKYAEYQTLLYDYNQTTAVGFDGNYFYLVHQNSSNQNLTLTLLYYLYTTNKTFTFNSSTNVIAIGTFKEANFTVYSENSSIIVKGLFHGNFKNVTKFLRYFNFTTTNFTISGKTLLKNSSIIIYSLSAEYKNNSVYSMIGLKELSATKVYFVGVISSQPINESEILDIL